jgi:hypothetical protein
MREKRRKHRRKGERKSTRERRTREQSIFSSIDNGLLRPVDACSLLLLIPFSFLPLIPFSLLLSILSASLLLL